MYKYFFITENALFIFASREESSRSADGNAARAKLAAQLSSGGNIGAEEVFDLVYVYKLTIEFCYEPGRCQPVASASTPSFSAEVKSQNCKNR